MVLIFSVALAACVDTGQDIREASRAATGDNVTAASHPDTAIGSDGIDPDDGTEAPPPITWCGLVCAAATAEAAIDCSEMGVGGAALCGMATSAICEQVCNSGGPRAHCSHVAGGKGCSNQSYTWWCDTAVDGNRVRMHYELKPPYASGIVETGWAPSRACNTVGFPTAGIIKRWRICAENNGCSGWFYP